MDKKPIKLSNADEWILAEFSEVNNSVKMAWEKIDIYSAAQLIKNFATGVFPSHWLEMVKSRLYDGDENTAWTLHRIVRDLLTIFSPICPFFTHYLSTTLYGESSVDIREFPEIPVPDLADSDKGNSLRAMTHHLISFNSDIWKAKKDTGLSLNSPISNVSIPEELTIMSDDLIKMHKLE